VVFAHGMLLSEAEEVRLKNHIINIGCHVHTNLAFFRHVITSGGRDEDLCGCEELEACQLIWAEVRDMAGDD